MSNYNFEELSILIEVCEDVDFAPKKDWEKTSLIEQAETDLGFKLPTSYKWWINHYKGGELGFDQEVYSLSGNTAHISSSDIVRNHTTHENDPRIPENSLIFFRPFQGEEVYFFEISECAEEYNVSVYRRSDRAVEPYADNFIEFMIKFIKMNYGPIAAYS